MTVIVLMGVSGSGKTTIGQVLAERLGCPFYDGDDFHPPENVAKMARGTPLTDADRAPWLARLQGLIHQHLAGGSAAVLACSALKRRYRDQLREGNDRIGDGLRFVYLHGDFDTIWARMQARQDHYMKPEMLQSQFDALEPPSMDEAIQMDITESVWQMINKILNLLQLKNYDSPISSKY